MYLYVGILLAGLAIGFGGGWTTNGWRYGAIMHARDVAAQRDTAKRIDRIDEAATSHEAFKSAEEVKYVERIKVVRQIVDHPIYRNSCLDESGRLLINSAARGEDPGQPAPAVPGTAKP